MLAIDGLRELQQQNQVPLSKPSEPKYDTKSIPQSVKESAIRRSEKSVCTAKDESKPIETFRNVNQGHDESRQFSNAKDQDVDAQFENNVDGFSTPSHTGRSKISSKRMNKAFKK